jgi:hypothetical protein
MLLHFAAQSQSAYRIGAMPVINLSKGVGEQWSVNLKLESRQTFIRGEFGSEAKREYRYNLTDISLDVSRKVALTNSVAAGYKARITADTYFHELRQQYTMVRRYGALRMGYRFAANQIFASDIKPEFILRYRMSFVIPMSGMSVDPGEFYLKLNNEYLSSLLGEVVDFEIRMVPLAGYDFNDNNKLEFGLDYRMSAIFETYLVHSFWVNVSWYYKL